MAVPIAQKLHLDMLGAADELLEEHVRAAEGVLGLAAHLVERGVEPISTFHDPHAAAATAHRRLDDHRIAQRPGHLMRPWAGQHRRVAAGKDRHAGLAPGSVPPPCRPADPVAPAADRRIRFQPPRRPARTPRSRRGSRIRGEWRQPASPAQPDDCRDVQIAADRLAGLPHLVRLIGLEPVQGKAILVRVNGHGPDA